MVLSIVDTIYVVIGGAVLVALYYLVKSDERWFQVRMGGLIFVGLLVLELIFHLISWPECT